MRGAYCIGVVGVRHNPKLQMQSAAAAYGLGKWNAGKSLVLS